MRVFIVVLFITLKCLRVAKTQCNRVMYNNEEFEIMDQKPGFSSCKGRKNINSVMVVIFSNLHCIICFKSLLRQMIVKK